VSELSPRAADLVRAGRQAGRPTEEDRERNLAGLRARLGAAPLPSVQPRQRPRRFWPKAAVLVAGLGAGAALALTIHKGQRSEPIDVPPAISAVVESATPKEAVRAMDERAPGDSELPAPPALPSATPRRPARDRLAEEIAILSRAAHYLEAGRASEALRAVDEHQRKFPNGMLTEERYAARVQALCALGRRDEAATELARLSRLAPQSPHLSRARQSCAAPAATAPSPSDAPR